VQSSYIPWKGYFDMMQRVDEFILYDDAQYTRRDWRNRNRIKTKDGLLWLTIPVEVKGKFEQAIKDVRISDARWAERHMKTIAAVYARAPHFRTYREALDALYRGAVSMRLSEVNRHLTQGIADLLGITTRLSWSMDYELPRGRVERLVGLCQRAGARVYVSGPSARDYLDPAVFAAAGIELAYMDYSGYPEYPQLYPPFAHQVSIVDVLVHAGPAARACLTSTAALMPA
jgi:WbqC-like protein